jgi:hypothetical protein
MIAEGFPTARFRNLLNPNADNVTESAVSGLHLLNRNYRSNSARDFTDTAKLSQSLIPETSAEITLRPLGS